LEYTDIVVSWSEIQTARACPLKHWLSYRQRQPSERGGRAADIGTVWHLLQQDWYRGRQAGRPIDELATGVPARHLTYAPTSEAEEHHLSTLLWMWDGFLLNGDPFADCSVLAVEQEFRVPLPRVPGQPAHVRFWLKSIIDLILQQGNRLLVVDHKSQAKHQSAETLSRDMDLEDQLGLYLYTCKTALRQPARSMSACWSYAVTTDTKKSPRPPEDRFWRAWSARTEAAIWRTALEATETALAAYARPLDVEPPRHPDKEACRWRCDWRDRCYVARDSNRSVRLLPPTREDQAPSGVHREGY
jgi:hypothetical protein